MSELKTLKDITKESISTTLCVEWIRQSDEQGVTKLPVGLTNDKDLKQEAIKHIKVKIDKIEKHCHQKFSRNNHYLECLQCRNRFVEISWIKQFFNITEEDLRRLE